MTTSMRHPLMAAALFSAVAAMAFAGGGADEGAASTAPGWLLPGGEIVTVTKLDDTTVRFGFSVPYPPMLSILSNLINTPVFAPKHYLQKWHIAHNDDATAVAKQEGFDDWWGAFVFHPAFLVAAIGHNRPSRVRHRR